MHQHNQKKEIMTKRKKKEKRKKKKEQFTPDNKANKLSRPRYEL